VRLSQVRIVFPEGGPGRYLGGERCVLLKKCAPGAIETDAGTEAS